MGPVIFGCWPAAAFEYVNPAFARMVSRSHQGAFAIITAMIERRHLRHLEDAYRGLVENSLQGLLRCSTANVNPIGFVARMCRQTEVDL